MENYDRGKVLNAKALDEIDVFGRYLDVEGTVWGTKPLPGTPPEKGAFFTRGTSVMSSRLIQSRRGLPKKYGTFVE
ncbi:MAG: hypothetical protein Ct9H90mP27_7420 [Gammaproteobacteria bacterium]|nr:MAG: hypothetical protein Ct9H90mP27_7420 [Gammaproteobacteria bacterium]